MHEVKIINASKKIIQISWIGKVSPEDIQQANTKIDKFVNELKATSFDLIVDMTDITVLLQEKELVKHQEWLLAKAMGRAAVITNSAIAKMQLKRTAKESSHQKEFHFKTYDDATAFLTKAI